MSAPRFAWAEICFNTAIDPALLAVAEHMRARAASGDVLALDRPDTETVLQDQATVITALTGIPAFVSRPKVYSLNSDRVAQLVRQRLLLLESVAHAGSYEAAAALLGQAGIRWYVAARPPQWDPAGARAAFKAGAWLLFRFD
jgi:hypothetical protein